MQITDNRAWYAAFKAKDARFDGRFFVGVSSTDISAAPYARQNCREKKTTRFMSPPHPPNRPGTGD